MTETLTPDEAIERLAHVTEPCSKCESDVWEGGTANHDDSHPPRRVVTHGMSGSMGCDWDLDAAVDFIRKADFITPARGLWLALGHGIVARSEGRVIAFSTKEGGG